MELKEFKKYLKDKGIDMREFRISYIVPTIEFKNKKERVIEADISIVRNEEEEGD